MPQWSRRRARPQSDDEDDEEDSRRYSQADTKGPKRQRRSLNAEEDENESDENSDESPGTNGINGTNDPSSIAQQADEDGFHPGTIRRVLVENFVTYRRAEFFPGPSLNMVLGPNGTGKSSLVCAICLGLGFSPKTMGRASSASDFVKNGSPRATIEIELQKRPQDPRNYVVKTQIDRERSSQKWWLNGRDTTLKAIKELMRKLHVQIDNLCQFLPQDRVVEFAGLTPVELLHETLRAAAPEQMLQWQKELQTLHKNQRDFQQRSVSYTETLGNLENRQQAVQADVERLREREEVQTHIANLKKALPYAKYSEANRRYKELKKAHTNAEIRHNQLKEESEPSLHALRHKEEYKDSVTAVVRARADAVKATQDASQNLLGAVDDADSKLSNVRSEMEAAKVVAGTRRKDMEKVKRTIREYEIKLQNKPADFDPQQYNQKIRAHEHEVRELDQEDRELGTQMQDLKGEGQAKNSEKEQLNDELHKFNSQEGQMLRLLENQFPDAAKGYKWLKDNLDKFEQEVFGPALLSCTIKDKRYSDHVQAALGTDDMLCFTTQSRADHERLSNYFFKDLRLSVSIRTSQRPLSSFKKPSPEGIASRVFDSYAIDCLNGPEPVLAMLCADKRLHLTGVAMRDVGEDEYDQLLKDEGLPAWATGRRFYQVNRRREYGPGATSVLTKDILQGRFWKDEVDVDAKREIERRLEMVVGEFRVLKEKNTELKEQRVSLARKKDDLQGEIIELQRQKKELQTAYNAYKVLPDKLANEQVKLASRQEEVDASRAAILDLQDKLDERLMQQAQAVLAHRDGIDAIRDAQKAFIEAQIREIEAQSDFTVMKERNEAIIKMLEDEQARLEELNAEKRQQHGRVKHLLESIKDSAVELSEEDQIYIRSLAEGKSGTDLDEDIHAEEAKLELIHAANPNAIREYEKRAQEISRLQEKLEEAQSQDGQLARDIKDILEQFEPQLDELVSKINDAFAYNFEQISCAGEVRVHKDQDFEQWALQILVRFRENETLQQLNQQRQSGGERAVSTVFFLMALQAMAQAPFRVVDEINQGMDPRNERMVHHRMVDIACREHTSQYFLITPKLLPGLRYDERMRVLCIASGEHMPTEGGKVDFRRCLKNHKQRVSSVGASA